MAVDIHIKIDTIPGQSEHKGFEGQIQVENFSWAMNQVTNFGSATGGGAGKVNLGDLTFTHFVDKATPKLMIACRAHWEPHNLRAKEMLDAGELGRGDLPAIERAFELFDQVLGVLSLRKAEDEAPPVPVEEIEARIGPVPRAAVGGMLTAIHHQA